MLLSFGSPWLFNTGPTTGNTAVAIGDVSGDGVVDLVTATTSGGVNIALGNGDGTFEQSQEIAPFANSLSCLTLADLDSQHCLDIVTDPAGNQVWVLLNRGNGTFGTPIAYSTGAGSSPADVAVVDLGDGHPDIITANHNDNAVSVLLGNGDGTFQTHNDIAVDSGPVAVAVGDLNNDGHPDVVTANTGGNSVSVLRSKGDGTFGRR